MNKSYLYRIYPTKNQINLIHKINNDSVFLYNAFLQELINRDGNYDYMDMMVDFAFYKMKNKLVKNLNFTAIDCIFLELDKNNKKCKKNEYPKFKEYNDKIFQITVSSVFRKISYTNQNIDITPFGILKTKNKREPNGKIIKATIKRTATEKYYISLCCTNVDVKENTKTNKYVGLDLGVYHFCITSKGEKINNPKFFKNSHHRLKKKQRQLARKTKGSQNYEKQRLKVAREEERIANQRRNFLHQLSTQLVKEYDVICIESLNIKKMVKDKRFSKSIHDTAWGEFIKMLDYKAKIYGKTLIKVSPYYPSSQKCNHCGFIDKRLKNLKIREWECPICRTVHDRDINAAINILNEGLKQFSKNTDGTAGIKACGDEKSVKQEPQETFRGVHVSRGT